MLQSIEGGAILGQMVLESTIKQAGQAMGSKPVGNLLHPSSCSDSFSDEQCRGSVSQVNPFLHIFLSVMVFHHSDNTLRRTLCNPGQPRIHYVVQASLQSTVLLHYAPQPWLQAWITTPNWGFYSSSTESKICLMCVFKVWEFQRYAYCDIYTYRRMFGMIRFVPDIRILFITLKMRNLQEKVKRQHVT